jgi:hypothetical protein
VLARLLVDTGHPDEPHVEATVTATLQRPAPRAGDPPTPPVR